MSSLRNILLIMVLLLPQLAWASSRECVVVIADIARPQQPLDYAVTYFHNAGYTAGAVQFPENYSDINYTLEALANHIMASAVDDYCPHHVAKIHFVVYGLGVAVLNQYLFDYDLVNIGRIVMIEPATLDTFAAKEVHLKHPLYRDYLKFNASEYRKRTRPPASRYWDIPVGVIASKAELANKYGMGESREDKRRLLFVPGMETDIHVTVNPGIIMHNDEVFRQAVSYLQTGSFDKGEEE